MRDELYHHIAMIIRNANTFEACLRKKAHVCSSSLWRSNCSWPFYPWSGNTILFSPGFIGMKNATPPGPIFKLFFLHWTILPHGGCEWCFWSMTIWTLDGMLPTESLMSGIDLPYCQACAREGRHPCRKYGAQMGGRWRIWKDVDPN